MSRRRGSRVFILLLALILLVTCQRSTRREQQRPPSPAETSSIATPTQLATVAVTEEVITTTSDGPGESGGSPPSFTVLTEDGGRLSWSATQELIAFDRLSDTDYYAVYTMRRDGSEQQCLTCDITAFASRHVGNPAWHPSGEWIAVQVERQTHEGGSRQATPGRGLETDVWVISSDGRQFFQLTEVPDRSGTLHPHFSKDGTRLSWTERLGAGGGALGRWELKMADFAITDSGPQLSNVQSFRPLGDTFYENHGFSPDGSRLLFSAIPTPDSRDHFLEIYTLDLGTQELTQLTEDRTAWNEHAHYSPDGEQIIWASSRDSGWNGRVGQLVLEWWIMDSNGENPQQLSHFNDPEYAEYRGGERVVAADSDWGEDGTMVGYLIINRGMLANFIDEQGSPIVSISLPTP